MNRNEKYFVALISSHLNNQPPPPPENTDWEEIYRLAGIHNVCAIIANQIFMLKPEEQPNAETLSKFRQQMGYTVIDSDEKKQTRDYIRKLFTENKMEYMFVKGAILRNYYPVKDFRTGSDTDVLIRNEDMDKCRCLIKEAGLKTENSSRNVISAYYNKQHIEIHSDLDYDNPFFQNIFDMCERKGYEYIIGDQLHLLYVMCHIIKHFNMCGAGIKMFMDIDVLIRHMENFDYNAFMEQCRDIRIETFARASLALCAYWFGTPVNTDIDLNDDTKLRDLFETEIMKSGNFGFNARDLGDYYINKGMGSSGKNGLFSKLRALIALLFPEKKYLMNQYAYTQRRPYLLPLAWVNRLFDAVLKRKEHSKNTVRSILSKGDETEQYKKLLTELDIQ